MEAFKERDAMCQVQYLRCVALYNHLFAVSQSFALVA